MFEMNKKEKEVLEKGVDIIANKIKSVPKVLWRDRKYVAIKIIGFAIFAWSIVELLENGSLDVYDRETYSLQAVMGAIAGFMPATMLQEALDGTPRRRKRKEEK